MHVPRVIAFAMLLAFAATPTPTLAADNGAVRKKVQKHLNLAARAFETKEFAQALAELQKAEALTHLAAVRFDIARCMEELGQHEEAVAAYQKYLESKDSADGAANRAKRAAIAIGRLKTRIATEHRQASDNGDRSQTSPADGSGRNRAQDSVSSNIETRNQNADGAKTVHFLADRVDDSFLVTVDSKESVACQTPCELDLSPGKHTIAVSGSREFAEVVAISTKSTTTIRIERKNNGWLAFGIASLAIGGGLTGLGLASQFTGDHNGLYLPGVIACGAGIAIATVGGTIGFKMKGSDRFIQEQTEEPRTSRHEARLARNSLLPSRPGISLSAKLDF